MNEAKMTELTQAEDMAFFRADLCLYSPESYTLDEKKEICNDMFKTSKAIQDAMRADTLVQIAHACGYKLVLEGNGEKIELDPEPFVNQVVVEYDPSSIERPRN